MNRLAFLLASLACFGQIQPGEEELALRSDPAWKQLVVVLSNGRRVTYQRAEVKSVLYLTAGDFSSTFTSGATLSGEARDRGRSWPFKIRITSHNPASGAIAGEITWTSLNSIHQIHGTLSGKSLEFTETAAIRRGSAHLHVTYKLTVSASGASGTYHDPSDNGSGTTVINPR